MRALGVIIVSMAGLAEAANWTEVSRSPVTERESAGVRWSQWLESATSERCGATPWLEDDAPGNLRFNCLRHKVQLRNDSGAPVQCRFELRLSAGNFRGDMHVYGDEIIYPGQTGDAWPSLGPVDSQPRSITSSCRLVDSGAPAPVVPAGCSIEVKTSDFDDYYPKDSLRKGEEGVAVVEYLMNADGRRIAGIDLVKSSGSQSLDRAALRYGKLLRVKSNCPGQRFRHEIRMTIPASYVPPAPQTLQ
jgi:TonB family protein